MNAPAPLDGHEYRGFQIKLYPTDADIEVLTALRESLRCAWNWMVKNTNEEPRSAAIAWLIRAGIAQAKPQRPNYDGMTPEDSEIAAIEYRDLVRSWWADVGSKLKQHKNECPHWRTLKEWMDHFGCKQDYQLIGKVISWAGLLMPGAHMRQALVKQFFAKSARPKRARRRFEHVPLRVRSGTCFEVGDFGERRGRAFYNCQISINGLKIRGRLPGAAPKGRVLQGVSITEQADGWWASVKVEQPIRALPRATPGKIVGIDVGLDSIAAFSDSDVTIPNARDLEFAERIADMQSRGGPVGRTHLRMARHLRHVINSKIVKHVADAEVIAVERLPKWIGQRGSRKVSVMRSIVGTLRDRYGDRVREVDPAFTSQDCSNCGVRDKESWSYFMGPIGKCPSCGVIMHRDINAARNIAAKASKEL